MWVCLGCTTRGCSLTGFTRPHDLHRTELDECFGICNAVWWAWRFARPQWHRLDWHMLQAIIITRLHAMYQGSRRILIFLIVTFLAINIFSGVGAIIITMYTSGGAFYYGLQKICISLMNTRGIHHRWHLSVLIYLHERFDTYDFH
jgi:hypothetical protein